MRHSIQEGFYKIVTCRRSLIALTAMTACVIVSKMTGADTSGAIAMIAVGLAGANAAEASFTAKKGNQNEQT